MNNVLYYQEEFKEMLYIRKFIEESIPSAIDEKQFQMYLQPKYSIVQNHIVGAEALVRWQHPDRGMIYPNEFIPVIEENGYIKKVDYYIWKEACNFLKRCEQAGIKNCPVSVNVSRLHLTDTVFMDYLAQTIHEADIPKEQLELEITETIGDEQRTAIWSAKWRRWTSERTTARTRPASSPTASAISSPARTAAMPAAARSQSF